LHKDRDLLNERVKGPPLKELISNMRKSNASTSKKTRHTRQKAKKLAAPPIVPGNTYIFAPPGRERVEHLVLEVTDSTVTYLKKSGPMVCQLSTFQRMYAECGAGIIEGEAAKS
jgi:hypothetical protein